MNLKKFLKIIVLTSVFLILSFNFINADEIEEDKNYTDEYKSWLELPSEERKKYFEPRKYSIDYVGKLNNDRNIKLKSNNSIEYYNLFDELVDENNNRLIRVKDQKDTGTCWAFSTTSALETTLLKTQGENLEFSPRHIEYSTSKTFLDGINEHGYNRELRSGGNAQLALNYITSGFGPVLEKDMPFEANSEQIPLADIENKDIKVQVDDYILFPNIFKEYDEDGKVNNYTNGYAEGSTSRKVYTEDEIKNIRDLYKNHIMNYGGISVHTYMSDDIENEYLNASDSKFAYYCYDSTQRSNHAVTIIGWDDNYSKENFNSNGIKPKNDGAYIILDSHGDSKWKNGIFYISYDDAIIEKNNLGVVNIHDKNYDNIYQHDLLGFNQSFGYGGVKKARFANVFKKKETDKIERLEAISFYCNNQYKIKFYVNTLGNELNYTEEMYLGEMNNLPIGYHTFKLDTPIELNNEYYSICLEVENEKSNGVYFGAEKPDGKFYDNAVSNTGESYSLKNGSTSWVDAGNSNVNYCIKAFTNSFNDISNVTIEDCNDEYVYTGTEIKPKIKLKDGDKYLTENTDYKVTYSNNINVGTAKITIEGISEYIGNLERTFEIVPKDISELDVNIDTSNKEYTGSPIATNVLIKNGSTTLIENEDYEVSYQNNTNVGEATVIVNGKGNYTGEITNTFEITPISLYDLEVTINTDSKVYTGSEITTGVVLKNGDYTLVEGTDYTVSYQNNTNVGEATVTVNGIGNYTGEVESKFKIVAKKIADLRIFVDTDDKPYTGEKIQSVISLWDSNYKLIENKDYIVKYDNNLNVGKALVTINGIGEYAGIIQKQFNIVPREIYVSSFYTESYNDEYTGYEKKIGLKVKYNNIELQEGKDYILRYINNINVGRADLTVIGIGNFTDSYYIHFNINKVNNPASISTQNKNIKYKKVKKKKQTISAITVENAKGNVTYYKASGNKNFTINKKTGKITVKKKTKKGTYKIKIKVKVAGDSNYNEKTQNITVKIKIK